MESFAALFEESLEHQEMRQGEVITAEIVGIDHNFVTVNAGLKSESLIPLEEFKNDQGEIEAKVGDFVAVAIESIEDGFGATKLSRERAKKLAAWLDLEAAMNEGRIVTGMVQGKVKGGLTVLVGGLRAFLPGSLVDMRPVKDTTPFEYKEMEFKVIKLDRKRNNVVVSRRAVLEETMGADREAMMENLKEGSIVKGVVKNITDYGAFVDLGGIDGRCTSPTWPGAASSTRPKSCTSARNWKPRSCATTPRRTVSRSASSSWVTIRGSASRVATRRAPACSARSPT